MDKGAKNKSQPRILVVDDDPSALLSIEVILEDNNYKIFFAESGKRALQIARKFFLNLALIDLSLPDIIKTAK